MQEIAGVEFEAFKEEMLPKIPIPKSESRRPAQLSLCSPLSPTFSLFSQSPSLANYPPPSSMSHEKFEEIFGPIITSFAEIRQHLIKLMFNSQGESDFEIESSLGGESNISSSPPFGNEQLSATTYSSGHDETLSLSPSSTCPEEEYCRLPPPPESARHNSLPGSLKLLQGTIHQHLCLKIGKLFYHFNLCFWCNTFHLSYSKMHCA